MIEGSYLILFYILLWSVVLIYHFRKQKAIDAGGILMLSYLLYGVASFILLNDDYYGNLYTGLSIFPFIYLFSILYITSTPIRRFNTNRIDMIQQPSMLLLNSICVFYILMQVACIPGIISNINVLGLLFTDDNVGAELYKESVSNSQFSSSMGVGVSNIASIFSNFLSRLGVLFFFYYLTLPKKSNNKLMLFGLAISVLCNILSYLLTGQRGGTFKTISTCIITYFALRKFIPQSINKKIKIVGFIVMVVISIPYYFLSASRFSDSVGGVESSLYSYMGQGNLNFNLYGLDDNGIRYGDRVVPIFKKMMGISNVPNNFWERRWKYPHLKVNDEVFYTYVGDFTIDFGPILGGLILIAVSLFITAKTKVKRRTVLFHQLILLHFIMCICMEGGMSLYPFSDSSNMVIIVYIIAYFLFKFEYLGRLRKQKLLLNQ